MKLRKLLILVAYFVHTVSCQNEGSLTFVLDNSYSMKTDIEYVKHGVVQIMDMILMKNSSPMENFVLVTFNNTSYKKLLATSNIGSMKNVLKNIRAGNLRRTSKDCSKMSLRGVKLALESSKNYSNLFVFTDASPKDYKLTKEVIQLAKKKSSQVLFFITEGNHCIERPSTFNPYYEIANATYGQVLKLNAKTEIKKVLNYTAESCFGETTVLVQSYIPANKKLRVTFDVDDETEYVVISASGSNVEIDWKEGLTIPVGENTRLKNFKAMNLLVPKSGRYSVTVWGASVTYVIGYGKTSFLFNYGFSLSPVRSLRDTVKSPTAGEMHLLAISVSDPNRAVSVDAVELLDMNKKVLTKLSLTRKSSDFYTTKLFLPPKSTFLIAVLGKGKYLQKPIKRFSETAIQPKIKHFESSPDLYYEPDDDIQDRGPIVTVNKVKNSYEYNSKLYLNCNVKGHPKPHLILWRYENGTSINAPIKNNPPYNYSTHITVQVKKSQRYTCYAENKFGSNSKKDVFVKVDPPFVVNKHLKDVTFVSFEKDIELICDIKSKWPMRITWWKNGKIPVTSSLSNDGTKLTIKKVNIQDQDTYACEAKLLEDYEKRSYYQTKLKIKELKPIVTVDQIKKTYEYNSTIRLDCYVKGYPKPQINWTDESGTILRNQIYLKHSSYDFSNQLKIENVKKPQRYTCHAQNNIGNNSLNVFVNVGSPFVVKKHLEDVTFVSFEKDIELICDIKSKWPMRITWWKNGKIPVTSSLSNDGTKLTIKEVNIQDQDTYACEAELLEDYEKRSYYQTKLKIKELKPLVTIEKIKKTYGFNSTLYLNCNVKSLSEPQTNWKDQNGVTLRNMTVKKNSPYDYSYNLTVEKINKSQNYTCIAHNKYGNNSENVFVKVDSASVVSKYLNDAKPYAEKVRESMSPEIEKPTKAFLIVKKAEPVTLTCKITKGLPEPERVWRFKEIDSDKWINIKNSEERLTIERSQLSSGDYKCLASNLIGHDKMDIHLTVEVPPEIVSSQVTVSALEFDLVLRIPCETFGYPKPNVTWRVNGSTIGIGTSTKYKLDKTSLIILNPVKHDSGNYTCEVKNLFGSKSKTIEAIVKTNAFIINPSIKETTTAKLSSYQNIEKKDPIIEYNILEGSIISLNCLHAKNDTVRWYKDNQYLTITGPSLVIMKATTKDDGIYKCLVSNYSYNGTQFYSFKINVGYEPRGNTDPVIINKYGNLNQTLSKSLECQFDVKPMTNKIEWTFNGERIIENITDFNGEITEGIYTCSITNLYGTAKRTFTVVSNGSIWPHIYYNENYLRVPRNISSKMFCSNQKENNIHFESFSKNNEILATCVGENQFLVNGTIVKFEDLQCNLPIRHIINETGATCFNENSELIKVGFEVDQFVEVYEVCVDKTTMVPLYTRIDMTPLFNVKSTPFKTARVNEIIGDKCGESSKCCFGKTKLVSENDVRYGPSQAATFIEMNYVPYWRPCDGQLDWNDIEENITRKLEQIEGQFVIWSGASNYTKKSDVVVPRYLWKVVKIVDSEYSFSFVYVNDPNPTLKDKLCKDICNQFDWIISSYSTYCCRLEEFRKAFHIPENLK